MFSQFVSVSTKVFKIKETPHRICFDSQSGKVSAIEDKYCASIELDDNPIIPSSIEQSPFAPKSFIENKGLVNSVLNSYAENSNRISGTSVVIMPTSQCNFSCAYCGQIHRNGNMTRPIESGVVERIEERIKKLNPEKDQLNISWFGGEPLLGIKSILRISNKINRLCDKIGVSWRSKMPTNGYLLTVDNFVRLYSESHLREVEVTLDGPREAHDSSRPLKFHGASNFDIILNNLTQISTLDGIDDFSGSIRVNVHAGNIEKIPELIELIAATGICKSVFSMNIVPVYDWGDEKADGKIDRIEFSDWELNMCRLMQTLGVSHSLFPISPSKSICTAVDKFSEVITTNGRIFSCTEEPLAPSLDPSRSVGHVLTLSPKQRRPRGEFDTWIEEGIKSGHSHCSKCSVLPLCGGSCPKQWYEGNIPCPPWKFNISERLDELGIRMGFEIYESA